MKKTTIYIFLYLVIAVLLFQKCKKDTSITNEGSNTGYVKEYYTNKPIPNAQVGVYSDMNYSQLVENVYTDSLGKFVTNENIYNNANILVTKSGYFQYTFGYTQTNRDRNNNIFWLDLPTQLFLHIKNTKPISKYDAISLTDFANPINIEGNNIDTLICCFTGLRFKQNTIHCWVTKGGPEYANHVTFIPMDISDTVNIFY